MPPLRLALVCDYLEERWASMDLVGEMILTNLERFHADRVSVTRVRPDYRHVAARLPAMKEQGVARNVDRLLNRMGFYPWETRALARSGRFDLFHIVDHSYSHLVHALPADRTVVTCHDLDAFRCLLDPSKEPRPLWFQAMSRRILDGMRAASAVVCDSDVTRRAILAHGLVSEERLHLVHLAIDEAMTADADPMADAEAARLVGPFRPEAPPDLLHVGTNIPRKRIEVALQTLAGVRRVHPGARLLKVGGAFTPEQARLIDSLGLGDAIVSLPFTSRAVLAAVYRRAALVLQPSDAEGFGFPVVEAMTCGTPVLASAIDVLREVGGPATAYAAVGDVADWTAQALALLDERTQRPLTWEVRRARGVAWTKRFQWKAHVARLVEIYGEILDRPI